MNKLQKEEFRTDHKGKVYPSLLAMCRAYNINYMTYRARIELGWSVEKALTHPTQVKNRGETTAPNGKTYPSKAAMCRDYGIPYHIYKERIRSGMNKEIALTQGRVTYNVNPVKDHNNVEYKSFTLMCEAYGKTVQTVKKRLKRGMTLEEALTRVLRGGGENKMTGSC